MTATPLTPALPGRPRMTRLVLSKAGRRVVVLFIVLGVLLYAGAVTAGVITGLRTTATARRLDRYHNEAVAAFRSFSTEAQGCAVSGGLPCLQQADLRLAASLERFGRQLESLRFPLGAIDGADRVRADTARMIDVLHGLASASAADYQRRAAGLPALVTRFDEDYGSLAADLAG